MMAGSGRGLKIAVIDSGVNLRHPHICAPTRGVVIDPEDENLSSDDPIGHGTAVTAAIQEKAPGAQYFALKLFGPSLRATSDRLIAALEWTMENRMDIVNLSLGTSNFDYRDKLRSLVECAASSGTLLVAARSAGQNPVLPGTLEGVIGVDVDWDLPRDRYRVSEADGLRYFRASGYPRPLPGVSPARNLNGISFAVANMTGFVALAREVVGNRSVRDICDALASEVMARET
ncbi:MAG TPA: S8 family serine peptidase [Bryobacteraceae bacterium]|nr:S8 family serine peptidase [Bryobacteraceae bacterium]